jgi:hypothetical protein
MISAVGPDRRNAIFARLSAIGDQAEALQTISIRAYDPIRRVDDPHFLRCKIVRSPWKLRDGGLPI